MNEQPTSSSNKNAAADEDSKPGALLNFLTKVYSLTSLQDTDPLPLWIFKILLRIIFILVMIALSPVIIIGLVLTFFMAL
jgi:hypothetical protein